MFKRYLAIGCSILFALAVHAKDFSAQPPSQIIAGHEIFVTLSGHGPFSLTVMVNKKKTEPAIDYKDVTVSVFDESGGTRRVTKRDTNDKAWSELEDAYSQRALGRYTVHKTSAAMPARVEVQIFGAVGSFDLSKH
jgi:hypothetical protein